MAGKVLILRWTGSAYESLGGLLDLIAQELEAQRLDVVLFPVDGPDWPDRLTERLQGGDITFALTMSGIAADMAVDGTSVWQATKVPLFNWNCDHPSYFPERHIIRDPFVLQGYVFPDHARYNITHLKPNGMAFAVHMGIPRRGLFSAAPLPLKSRNGRIILTKSGHDINKIEASWRNYVPDVRNIVFAAAEALLPRSTADFVPVLRKIAEPYGLFLDGDNRLAMLLVREIDAYIRARRANLVIDAVLRYPVDVFGSGWDHANWDAAQARWHGGIAWRAMIEQLPSYIGCLSINPLVDESVHDRTFFALSAGVVPISDSNAFSRAHLPALEPFAFTFTRERVEQAVEALLDRPEEALACTEETWQRLAITFSMRRASRQIMQFVTLQALNERYGA